MKNGRNTDGTFLRGNSGRPKGARNLKTLAIESLLEGQLIAFTSPGLPIVTMVMHIRLRRHLHLDQQALVPKGFRVVYDEPGSWILETLDWLEVVQVGDQTRSVRSMMLRT